MGVKFEKREDGYFLDVWGYVCPHSQLYTTRKALEKMKNGKLLEVLFDNLSSVESISAMCEGRGDQIIEKNFEKGTYRWVIKKA